MHRLLLLLLVTSQTCFAQEGKIRPYRPEEMKRWTFICEGYSKAVPLSFKNYTVTHLDCGKFAWAERDFTKDKNGAPLTVTNVKHEPTGNLVYYIVDYSMPEDSVDALSKGFDVELIQGRSSDGSFSKLLMDSVSAKSQKLIECKNMHLEISTNRPLPLVKQYYINSQPEKLSLPVDCFAYLYTIPEGKSLLTDNDEISIPDASIIYQDKALIILSSVPPKVVHTPINGRGTLREDQIMLQEKTNEVSTAQVKTIVVEVSGYEKDIRELLAKIDWKTLRLMLGK